MDGSIVSFNEALVDLIGYGTGEIKTFDDWADKLHPDPESRVIASKTIEQALRGKEQDTTEFEVICKDGSKKILEFKTSFFTDGLIIQLVDITERKKTQEQVRRQSEFLNSTINSLNHPLYVIDPNDYTVTMANEAAGFDLSQSRTCYELTHRRTSPCSGTDHLCPLQTVVETKTPTVVEHTHVDAAGNDVPCEIHAYPMFDDAGTVTGIIEYSLDVSERKKAYAALRARDEAEAANAAKSEFLATMSHEIRTPINGVIGMIQLLETTDLELKQQGYMSVLSSCAESLMSIVNDVLDYSKIEDGKLDIEPVGFDVRTVVAKTLAPFKPKARDKGLQLECTVQHDIPPRLVGDSLRIKQIIDNFLSNAIKFTPSGTVTMEVKLQDETDETVTLRVTVSDTGIGIASSEIDRLFEPFTQADESTTRNYGGTGLGLSIVKRLVELMGGSIGVQSELGTGSSFWFTVPLERGLMTTKPPSSGPEDGDEYEPLDERKKRARVLVVEDDGTNMTVALSALTHLGHYADGVHNGKEAIRALSRSPYDLVLMDLQMPVMGGLEATRAIRKKDSGVLNPNVPIIAMTAHAVRGTRDSCVEEGMDDYLAKPVRFAELEAVIERQLPSSSGSVESPMEGPKPEGIAQDRRATGGEAAGEAQSLVILDTSGLMRMVGGVEESFKVILYTFLESCLEHIEELRRVVEKPERVRKRAHQLRGAAASVGAQRVSFVAHEIERAADVMSQEVGGELIQQLREEFDALEKAVAKTYPREDIEGSGV